MLELRDTQEAFLSLHSSSPKRRGTHSGRTAKTGGLGSLRPEIPLDIRRDRENQKNPLSPMGQATGIDHIRRVAPNRPMTINIVTDFTKRNEHFEITDAKRKAARELLALLTKAVHRDDTLEQFALGQDIPTGLDRRTTRPTLEEESPEAVANVVANIAKGSRLTLLISDFQRFYTSSGQHNKIVGIKLNHKSERFVPENIGWYSPGGSADINTNDPNVVSGWNQILENHHQDICSELVAGGFAVASVVAYPNLSPAIDVAASDTQIAAAVRSLKS